ncbi:ATP-dependent DNA helicase DinG [Cohnella thailandensis]|uniref:3'-5' exonuclease DinG n=1 Tax=Cohnella thailandensis TaxID=557557 RepID=A0A841T0E3_9BACL|nr:ATP-dependent DNA helicase DinG [Cohnella thailandensis]MBB6635347.1 ATP-dependent DNA helicase DinG [Cohnella thailandensis]MBP1974726.1 ATP-dependent DNA helicase DinG [Cohnella thailandensis]
MIYAVLDFETTGTSPEQDEIIQVGLALIDDTGTIGEPFASYVKPSKPIPEWITKLTGIDDETVKDAPDIDEMLTALVPLLQDAVIVAHNAEFDVSFLQAALDKSGYLPFAGRVLDTVELSRLMFPSMPSYRLGALTQSLGIGHDRPHQADSDAVSTAELFLKGLERLRTLPLLTLQRLATLFDPDRNDLGWLIAEATAFREMNPLLAEGDYQYYRQFALSVGDWTEDEEARGAAAEQEQETVKQLAETEFPDFLSGVKERLKELHPSYESRQGQELMFGEVFGALNEDSHLLVEAGTGTGKSLGYLLPSLYYGLKESKKIVVSTHTIQLQEQLRQRDLPLLQQVLPVPFKASVFKGRSNYLCLRKFEQQMQIPETALSKDDLVTRGQMTVWLSETERGEAEELNLSGRSKDEWNSVASDADSCLNRQCPWFRKCFYHRARQDANKADLVITNHAMVFTDMRAENRLLPSYDRLIVDEAHHLEEVASHHLGQRTNYQALLAPLLRLWKDARNGQIPHLMSLMASSGDEYASAWTEKLEEAATKVHSIREAWEIWMDRLFGFLYSHASSDESGSLSYRFKPDQLPDGWDALSVDGNNVVQLLSDLIRPMEKLIVDIRERTDELTVQGVLTDMSGSVKELAQTRADLQSFVTFGNKDFVYWVEGHTQYRSRSVVMYGVPADVSGLLKEGMFDRKASVVLTSATLTVDKTFNYVKEQLGLDEAEQKGRLKSAQVPSPFKYREQALVLIPRDFPNIRGRDGDPQFIEALTKSIAEVASVTGGRMLVLFTSHRMLKTVYAPLKEMLSPSRIEVLGQGIDGSSRSRLTRQFQEQSNSVLLGTSSFWEGVDLPGDALTCLAIVRLPFQPPNHPVNEAKSERLTAEKKNPFMKLSLPQAVIRFKQGFGRLVRTATDKGIVIIYDTRVIDTNYGKYFLYSLPGPKMEHLPNAGLAGRVKEWLDISEDKPAESQPKSQEGKSS